MIECNECKKIKFIEIAKYLWRNLAWLPDEKCMSEFEKYEMLRDTIDGLICGITHMQDGEFDALDDKAFSTQADEMLESHCNACIHKKGIKTNAK
jgi:hypothetical protein